MHSGGSLDLGGYLLAVSSLTEDIEVLFTCQVGWCFRDVLQVGTLVLQSLRCCLLLVENAFLILDKCVCFCSVMNLHETVFFFNQVQCWTVFCLCVEILRQTFWSGGWLAWDYCWRTWVARGHTSRCILRVIPKAIVKYVRLYLTVYLFALCSQFNARHRLLIPALGRHLFFKLVFRQGFWKLKLVVVDCLLRDV